jgi:Tol biopolymer transport system component
MFLDLSTFISTQITHNYSSEISPLFTPDGEKILFERYDGNKYDLFLINKNGTGEQQLTFNGAQCPQFSPDGSKIVYYNPVNSMSEIFLLDLITNEIKTLTNRPNVLNSEPKYSPSGDLISYYSQDSVRVIDLQGNEIFSIPGYISSFSPSGDKIVFDKWEFKAMNIYIINSDGTDLLKLTDNADNSSIFCDRPVITPDGNSIIYERSVRGDFDEYLYIMNIDGSNKRILSDKIGEYSNVQIQPIL